MGKKSPKAPAQPDPVKTAEAQTASNKETAYWNAVLNNVNQVTPYGSISYSDPSNGVYDPNKAPQFSSTITLSPEQQAIYDSQTANEQSLLNMGTDQLGRINQSISSPYSYSGMGNEVSADDLATQTKRFEDALYSRINPQFERDEEAMRTRLINQGIGQNSEAYNREMERFNQAKNDARMQATLQGAQYGGTLQNQALQRRNQSIQEYDAQRNAPLNEYIGLTSGVQVQNPQFSSQGYGGAQSGDIQGATQNAYNNAMQQYNAKVAGNNSTQSSLFGLGGSLLGAGMAGGGSVGGSLFAALMGTSDIRLKTDIKHVGTENGHNIYEFRYKTDPELKFVGVMAQEVEKTHPEAVMEIEGYKAVNYDMIGVKMREVH